MDGKSSNALSLKQIWIFFFITCVVVIMYVMNRVESSYFSEAPSPGIKRVFAQKKPLTHIIYFLADDLGWNDVGYHGSFIHTPTIDQLSAEGVRLEKLYVNSICTPSRSAFLSGRYVIHTGLQHLQIQPQQQMALSLNHTLLPELLRHYGYRTYMVGKWHLGFHKREYTPENRGFDRFFGIYPGEADHMDHQNRVWGKKRYYCLMENGKPYWDNGTYDSHLYAQKAAQYVEDHMRQHPDKALFLFVSFQAVHTPLQVPTYYRERYENVTVSSQRKTLAGMATAMDEAIRNVTHVFRAHGIWDDTVTFFSTDNGGFPASGSSNHPLRHGKASPYEGGIRAVAFARGKGITPGRVSHELMHITDIYPTLIHLARQNAPPNVTSSRYMKSLDGFNMWDTISEGVPSPRTEILVNIDPAAGAWGDSLYPDIYNTGIRSAIIRGPWKLITGFPGWIHAQKHCPPEKYIAKELNKTKNVKLFNLDKDPYEKSDLFFERQDIVKALLRRLHHHSQSALPPIYPGAMCKSCLKTRLDLEYMMPYM